MLILIILKACRVPLLLLLRLLLHQSSWDERGMGTRVGNWGEREMQLGWEGAVGTGWCRLAAVPSGASTWCARPAACGLSLMFCVGVWCRGRPSLTAPAQLSLRSLAAESVAGKWPLFSMLCLRASTCRTFRVSVPVDVERWLTGGVWLRVAAQGRFALQHVCVYDVTPCRSFLLKTRNSCSSSALHPYSAPHHTVMGLVALSLTAGVSALMAIQDNNVDARREPVAWTLLTLLWLPSVFTVCFAAGLLDPGAWRPFLAAYLCAFMGMHSGGKLARLTGETPMSILNLKTMPKGLGGGVTFAGACVALIAGAGAGLVNAGCAGDPGAPLLQRCLNTTVVAAPVTHGALWGAVGWSLHATVTALVWRWAPALAQVWLLQGCLFVVASLATAGVAAVVAAVPAFIYAVGLAIALCILALAPVSVFVARKALHIITSVLVLLCSEYRSLIMAVGVLTLALLFSVRGLLDRFEGGSVDTPGIALYTLAVLCTAAAGAPLHSVLGPMMFADPSAALFGSSFRSPRLLRTSKTVVGSVTFMCVTAWWMLVAPSFGFSGPAVHWSMAFAVGGLLSLVELVSGKWDNVTLPVATALCVTFLL